MSENAAKRFLNWVDARLPVSEFWNKHLSKYYAPKNFNFWYYFGGFSLLVLVIQIVSGIFLTMYYVPTAENAFGSVEHIMRDVQFGWLIRYMHSTGASAFFIVIYLHMYRGIMYGSFKEPRELLWIFGMLIYVLLLMESASGYSLPWGQMSFWATKVLISTFTVVPIIGHGITTLLQGDYNVSGITLHRFFSFHVIAFPMLIVLLVYLHLAALHTVGSNNPDGIEIKKNLDSNGIPKDGIPFHPYYTVKDFFGVVVFLTIFFIIVFYAPTFFGFFLEGPNFSPANPLVTPEHIMPPWYMAPYYSILRAVPNKFFGVMLGAGAIAALFVLPWLDRSKVRSIRYRGDWTKVGLVIFTISFIGLGYLGTQPISTEKLVFARTFTFFYYLYFITLPFLTRYEETKTVPDRVT